MTKNKFISLQIITMRLLFLFITLFLISCGQKTSKKPEDLSKNDTLKTLTDTIHSTGEKAIAMTESTGQPPTQLEIQVNGLLSANPGNKWHVLNDNEARWISGQFDYFIAPKRKENPDYPYIAKGDFNGDGKIDIAAVVTDTLKRNYQLAIILNADEKNPEIISWKEDIGEDAAISNLPKTEIEGMVGDKTRKIKMKGDGINVEYFETASFVIYWNGSVFKRLQTGD